MRFSSEILCCIENKVPLTKCAEYRLVYMKLPILIARIQDVLLHFMYLNELRFVLLETDINFAD